MTLIFSNHRVEFVYFFFLDLDVPLDHRSMDFVFLKVGELLKLVIKSFKNLLTVMSQYFIQPICGQTLTLQENSQGQLRI